MDRTASLKNLGFEHSPFLLLSFGGSRGARTINKAMVEVLQKFAGDPRLNILHATGSSGHQEFMADCAAAGLDLTRVENIKVMPYIYNMQDALAADLVICRAGAATLAELTICGIPAILVPIPMLLKITRSIMPGLEKEGAALVVLDAQLNGPFLCEKIEELLTDRERMTAMSASSKKLGRRGALADIIGCVDELLAGR
ncbi:MAG: glycosyltransferase [Candidatus Syntrophopropionicum ammoniitolerans]